jgi:hypothetical protein
LPVPSGWQYENSPAQFQMASKDGKVDDAFYGSSRKNIGRSKRKLSSKIIVLQVAENNKTTINGNPAIAMISTQVAQSQSGQQAAATANSIQVATWLIQYGGSIYAIHGVAQAANFAGNVNQFKSVAARL